MKPVVKARRLASKTLLQLAGELLRLATLVRRGIKSDPLSMLLDLRVESQLQAEKIEQESRAERHTASATRVLILIPFRDGWQLTERCLVSLTRQKLPEGISCRVALIDCDSQTEETQLGLQTFLARPRAIGFDFQHHINRNPFHIARIYNETVRRFSDFSPDALIFMSHRIELQTESDLARLTTFTMETPGTGAVGPVLLYRDDTVRRLFLAPGVGLVAADMGRGEVHHPSHSWYQGPRNVPAISHEFLMVRTADFQAAGGFTEELATGGFDVDLCLALSSRERRHWTLPDVTVTFNSEKMATTTMNPNEISFLYAKWGEDLAHHNRFSPRLSRWSTKPALTLGEGPFPWRWLIR
jgi:hypothetical protein